MLWRDVGERRQDSFSDLPLSKPASFGWIDWKPEGSGENEGEVAIREDRALSQESSILGLGAESHMKICFGWIGIFHGVDHRRDTFEWLQCG